MNRTLIFLDCDGVINNWNTISLEEQTSLIQYVTDPVLIERLKLFCEEINPVIVITSTWRILHNRNQFVDLIGKWVEPWLMPGKSWRTKAGPRAFRGAEIETWLSEHRMPGDRYVILDDGIDFMPKQPLVRTNAEFGLTDDDIVLAKIILDEQAIIR